MNIKRGEKLIPLLAVSAVIVELTGVHRCKGTIYGWARKGCRTTDGRMVKLPAVKRMKQLFTTRAAIEWFIKEVG